MTFQMPQHVVDQCAADFRESGVPAPIQRIVVACLIGMLEQHAAAFTTLDAAGAQTTAADTAEILGDFGGAWKQLLDTM